jgi:CHAT domain-containing protein
MGQPGGFAGVCVRGECSVVIAPLWSVNDQVAYDVATHFYDDILGTGGASGMPVAEAMFHARSKPFTDVTFNDANGVSQTLTTATRLAYLVYGHPSFRF